MHEKDLADIEEEFGTPLYVYNNDTIIEQYNKLINAINWPKLKIFYAMKANYNPHILSNLKKIGANIDAVSIGEILLAKKIGFSANRILFTPNNITFEEMETAKKEEILFNIDSLSLLTTFSKKYPGSEICLRFNPDVVDGENAYVQTAGDNTKFGILLTDLQKVLQIVKENNMIVVGLHEHVGSGIYKAESFINAISHIFEIATKENFPHLKFFDMGGGFKVSYHPTETEINYTPIGDAIVKKLKEHCTSYGTVLELWIEPGKYIVAQSGSLLVKVTTIKKNKKKTIVGTNSGFSQLIRPLLYGAYHHVRNVSNPEGKLIEYDIYGNICESGDIFAKARLISEIREGDILSIENAGAYCYSMGSTYNLRPMPAEVIVEKGISKLARKEITPQELADNIIVESGIKLDNN